MNHTEQVLNAVISSLADLEKIAQRSNEYLAFASAQNASYIQSNRQLREQLEALKSPNDDQESEPQV